MAKLLCVLFALLFLNVWAATKKRALETKTIAVEPFSAINDCLPMNVKVEPSSAKDEYVVSIEGEESLLKAIDAKVDSGVLFLGLKRGFETERAIKVTVKVPANALDTITKSSTSVLVVSPGLEVKELMVMTFGVAAVRIFGADIDDLVVEADGSSIILAEGKIKKARLDVSGTAKTYVYGLTSEAEVEGENIGRIYIDAKNKDVTIKGRVEGLGHVFLTKGECDIDGSFFRSGCEVVEANDLPVFEAKFSCGLIVDGKIACGKDKKESTYISSRVDRSSGTTVVTSSSTSSSGSNGVKISSTTKTSDSIKISTSGDGKASATTSTSSSSSSSHSVGGGHHFESVVSTEGDADAVAVAATRCLDEDIDMFGQV